MANLVETMERKAFGVAVDATLKNLNKDREKALLQIVDLTEKFMGNNFSKEAYDGARAMIKNPDHKWMRYVNRLLDETDPHVAKMTALNLGFQAAFLGTKTIRKMREVHNCNIPWLILMDPTSACNLHCTGCWAAEYGNKLNLTFDHESLDVDEYVYPSDFDLGDDLKGTNSESDAGFEELSAMIGTYHYTSDYGTGRLMIEATEDGIDISDYESEDTYRFLANETNVKNEEENKVYLEYPAQVYEDDTVIFEYYILEKASDGIDVYYSPSSFDEAELLYHAVREN